jgi:hypothetical protein
VFSVVNLGHGRFVVEARPVPTKNLRGSIQPFSLLLQHLRAPRSLSQGLLIRPPELNVRQDLERRDRIETALGEAFELRKRLGEQVDCPGAPRLVIGLHFTPHQRPDLDRAARRSDPPSRSLSIDADERLPPLNRDEHEGARCARPALRRFHDG